jgi:hypothetical protein
MFVPPYHFGSRGTLLQFHITALFGRAWPPFEPAGRCLPVTLGSRKSLPRAKRRPCADWGDCRRPGQVANHCESYRGISARACQNPGRISIDPESCRVGKACRPAGRRPDPVGTPIAIGCCRLRCIFGAEVGQARLRCAGPPSPLSSACRLGKARAGTLRSELANECPPYDVSICRNAPTLNI